jgi:hypothetical protein
MKEQALPSDLPWVFRLGRIIVHIRGASDLFVSHCIDRCMALMIFHSSGHMAFGSVGHVAHLLL